jgi:hypothetical protein
VQGRRKIRAPRDDSLVGEAPPAAAPPRRTFRIARSRVDTRPMGIDVRLENEAGDEIETLLDFENSLQKILLECNQDVSATLRFIDPYGNTYFNRLQMPSLIIEIERASARLNDDTAERFAEEILRLAQRCQDEVNTYLKFYGG